MTAKELFDAGQLTAAIEQLNQDVRSRPTDAQLRTFLFELLCFAGDFERARRQLDVIGHQNASAEIGVIVYKQILTAEEKRQLCFETGSAPEFLFEPPVYAALHLEAIKKVQEGNAEEALRLLKEAQNSYPPLSGQCNGTPFSDYRDIDDLIGPFLEVIIQDKYVWLPFEQLKQITMPPPQGLRDLLWSQATLEAQSGPVGDVFVPVLYAGSSNHANDDVRLGRMTDWKPIEELALGVGHRMFVVNGQEQAVLETREVIFEITDNDKESQE